MGQVRVTVQEVGRLNAITMLAEAMVQLSKALNAAPAVTICDNVITAKGDSPGIQIDTSPDIWETVVEKLDGEDE